MLHSIKYITFWLIQSFALQSLAKTEQNRLFFAKDDAAIDRPWTEADGNFVPETGLFDNTGYTKKQTIIASLKKLASRNAKCQLKEYQAEHGLTIPILQINPDREAFFHLVLVAGIHAREVFTTELLYKVAQLLLDREGNSKIVDQFGDPVIPRLLDRTRITMFFVADAAGREEVENGYFCAGTYRDSKNIWKSGKTWGLKLPGKGNVASQLAKLRGKSPEALKAGPDEYLLKSAFSKLAVAKAIQSLNKPTLVIGLYTGGTRLMFTPLDNKSKSLNAAHDAMAKLNRSPKHFTSDKLEIALNPEADRGIIPGENVDSNDQTSSAGNSGENKGKDKGKNKDKGDKISKKEAKEAKEARKRAVQSLEEDFDVYMRKKLDIPYCFEWQRFNDRTNDPEVQAIRTGNLDLRPSEENMLCLKENNPNSARDMLFYAPNLLLGLQRLIRDLSSQPGARREKLRTVLPDL